MSAALLIAEPETETRGFLARTLASDGFEIVSEGPELVLLEMEATVDYAELLARVRSVLGQAASKRAEIGEAGHVVGAPLFPSHRAEEGSGDARTVEPLEQSWQAGQRDDQLGHGAGAHEGLDRGAEEAQRRLQLAVRGMQQGGVTGQETLEEPHVVLADVGDGLVPGLQSALRVRL